MLTIGECHKILGTGYSDEEVKKIRETLYKLAKILLREYQRDRIKKESDESSHILPRIYKRAS